MKKKTKFILAFVVLLIIVLVLIINSNFLLQEANKYRIKFEGKTTINVNLGEKFTLVKDQTAFINSENLKLRLIKITYSPCRGVCIWSGLGADFEVTKEGRTESGSTSVESNINNVYFGYEVDLIVVERANAAFQIIKCNSVHTSNGNKSCIK